MNPIENTPTTHRIVDTPPVFPCNLFKEDNTGAWFERDPLEVMRMCNASCTYGSLGYTKWCPTRPTVTPETVPQCALNSSGQPVINAPQCTPVTTTPDVQRIAEEIADSIEAVSMAGHGRKEALVAIAAILARREFADLRTQSHEWQKRAEAAEEQLRIIGDMAVVDWDAKTAGAVDAALKDCPFDQRKYAERVRDLYERARRANTAEARVAKLRSTLEFLMIGYEGHYDGSLDTNCYYAAKAALAATAPKEDKR